VRRRVHRYGAALGFSRRFGLEEVRDRVMSQSATRTSGYFADGRASARHAASRYYGDPDGDAPHACEFCSPEPETIALRPTGRHSAGVRPWGAQEEAWKPES
jgi:hypothetical protein